MAAAQKISADILTTSFLPYAIAVGMGLHNFGEGLAIGASYGQGQWALSGLMVSGFALHNGTERRVLESWDRPASTRFP